MPAFKLPRGLSARALILTTGLIVATATLTAVTLLVGAEQQSARHQISVTMALTTHFAGVSGNTIEAGDMPTLTAVIAQAVSRDEVRRISVRDFRGRILVEQGGDAGDAATVNALARTVLASDRPSYLRGNGGLALGAPIHHDGRLLGVAIIMWDGDAYRFNALPALAPFLLILACLALAAVPITANVVRRATAPLNELARYAEQVTAGGSLNSPINIQTGDEIEALATALNKMMLRLDESMHRIQEIAFVDPATQLPNQDRLAREIDHAILQGGEEIGAVAVFELQRASRLRQSLDPTAAREFLRAIADHLVGATQTVDRAVRAHSAQDKRAMAARLGAEEFAVFVPEVASATEAARFAQHLNAALNQPFEWRGHKLTLGAACGVALTPRDGPDAGAVIRRARLALGAAQSAPAQVRLFTPALDREAAARLSLEREMRGALDRNEFRAYFQPKINLDTGLVEACEALARWVRPDRTIIGPARFIPVAEETGLIGQLSDAIMREACWKAAAWARAGHPVKVAVNVSALQFRSDRFAENVLRILQHAGLPADHLELEITESVAMEDPERALRLIQPLRDAGVRLAIDDFGCGHSSLSALSKLPFDVIKIDQQFVRAVERGDAHAAAIVDMILALARTLKMEVVAEGVERREDVEFVAVRGCRWVQGFLYGAAMSSNDFADLLRRQRGERSASAA